MKASERVRYRRLVATDDAFIFELMNDAAWLKFIGDRGIKDQHAAQAFIQTVLVKEQQQSESFMGLYVMESLATGRPLGMVSILQRDFLSIMDIGYSLLPEVRGQGLAKEAITALLNCSRAHTEQVAAITSPENKPSITLLSAHDFAFAGQTQSRIGLSNLYLKTL